MSDMPGGAWRNLSMDFLGPLPSGEELMVLVDEYSRFPIVEIIHRTFAVIVTHSRTQRYIRTLDTVCSLSLIKLIVCVIRRTLQMATRMGLCHDYRKRPNTTV